MGPRVNPAYTLLWTQGTDSFWPLPHGPLFVLAPSGDAR